MVTDEAPRIASFATARNYARCGTSSPSETGRWRSYRAGGRAARSQLIPNLRFSGGWPGNVWFEAGQPCELEERGLLTVLPAARTLTLWVPHCSVALW